MNIVEANHLVRDYNVYQKKSMVPFLRGQATSKRVIDDISLAIKEGEFVGYLGPNGAGKSTTIKMLSGVLTPTSGEVRVMGLNPFKQRKKHAYNIGVLYGQRTQLWWDLPLIKSFELLQAVYGIPKELYKERIDYFVEYLEISEFLYRPVRQLSLGQRMKGEIVAALLHAPPLLFLDEPTIGLDLMAKEKIQDFLRMINKEQNVTVILTSHNMDDIKKLCSRIILIDHGKVMLDGKQEDLKQFIPHKKTLSLDLSEGQSLNYSSLSFTPNSQIENKLIFEVRHDEEIPVLISEISQQAVIKNISIEDIDIEDVVKEMYRTRTYDLVKN
ncbi:ABC-2 type transport system ATP-binding protein [Bacillus sp. TE9106W]|nr:ATP-binding cassette domain-containing protein [Bacillus cereus]